MHCGSLFNNRKNPEFNTGFFLFLKFDSPEAILAAHINKYRDTKKNSYRLTVYIFLY